MANVLEWTFRAVDQVSSPSKRAAGGVGDFIQTLHSGLAVMEYAAQAAYGLGNAIAAGIAPAAKREKVLGAFETILGTAQQARDLYAEALDFANRTPFATQDVVATYQQLLANQFQEQDLHIVARIVGDAASMQELPEEAMKSVNRALGQIKSKGKLTAEELMQVQEAVPLSSAKLYENLGRLYGKTAKEARALKEAGKIDADAGVFAILQTLDQQFGGNMERASQQVMGLWSTIESYPATYLEQLQDTRGWEALRGALTGVADAFNPVSDTGVAFSETVREIGSGVLEDIAHGLDLVKVGLGPFVEGLTLGLQPLRDMFGEETQGNMETFKTDVREIGVAFGTVVTWGAKTIGVVSDILGYAYKLGEWMAEYDVLGLGESKARYLPQGPDPRSAQARLLAERRDHDMDALAEQAGSGYQMGAAGEEAGEEFGEGVDTGVREALDINSPSRVFQEIGEHSASGWKGGWQSGFDERGPVEPGRMVQGGAGDAGGNGDASLIVHFTYQGGNRSESEAREISALVESGVMAALERLRLQRGGRRAI